MRLSTICLLLTISLFSYSQNKWRFNRITTDDGLSTGTVNCVYKDSKGYIWIGSVDGLNRYDGYDITIFKNDKNDPKSLSGNIITAITEDADGNIWVGTRNSGISIFDWETEKFANFNELIGQEIETGQVRALHLANTNEVLIGSEAGGIILYDPKSKSHKQFLADNSDLSNSTVLNAVKTPEGKFWISSLATSIDLFTVESGSFEAYPYDAAYEPAEINRKVIFQDSKGILWMGTDGKGLVRFDVETGQTKVYNVANSGLSANIVTDVFEAENGSIYIGTDGYGINILNPDTETFSYLQSSLLDPTTLSSNAVYQIYEDDSGVIWVSTFRGGVNTYSPQRLKFDLYQQIPYEPNSLSFASVIDVMETSDGYIWIGTDGGGLDRLDPTTGTFEHFKHDPNDPSSMSTNVAIALLEDDQGYIWVGTYAGGLNRLDRKTGVFKRFLPDPNDPTSINSKNAWHILQDSNGTIWIGLLNGGLDKYDPIAESFTHFQPSEKPGSLSSNVIICMLEDSKNNFWIGTENSGFDFFDRSAEVFTNFSHISDDSTSLLNNNVRTLFEDSKGQLWIGTSEGANIMNTDSKAIRRAPVNDLLPSKVINGIQEDAKGNLWISTNKGISKYNPKDHTIINFSKSDGLQGNEFNYTTSTKAKDGTMYFGGVKGLNAFRPSQLEMSTFQPNIVITDIRLFDQSIAGVTDENEEMLIDTSPQLLEELTLNYDQNVLEIQFSSLDFTSPQSNKYRYMLEGFDKDWVYTNAMKRAASYTNLDPDTYTFILEGTNSDGVWSSNRRTLIIKVRPPWWSTWWFRTLVVISIAGGVFLFARWRTLSHRRQKETLNEKISEATDKAYAQNEILIKEQENLNKAVEETNEVIKSAVESGDFSARISLEDKTGEWRKLSESINILFDTVITPFHTITEIVGALASSNLSKRYRKEAKGDILKLTSSLNFALDSLSDLIATIQQTTMFIGHFTDEMNESSSEMNVGTAEIAASTGELSNGAQEQVRRIDEASNTLENILELSSTMGDQAQSINQGAERGVQISEDGQVQMNKMGTSIEKMQEVSTKTGDSISVLSEKSSEISGILNSIKEISVETNMLALNAAIEAAKAGDAGRGFAVVADQIRKLAENSSDFAKEIENIISDVQDSIGSTSQLMNEMSGDIEESVNASRTATQSFTELSSSYAQTLNLSQQIVSFTDEQFMKVKEVVHLMESVVVISEEAAAGTEEIASSSNELSEGMTEYQERTQKVSEIVKLLNEKVNQFKLQQEE